MDVSHTFIEKFTAFSIQASSSLIHVFTQVLDEWGSNKHSFFIRTFLVLIAYQKYFSWKRNALLLTVQDRTRTDLLSCTRGRVLVDQSIHLFACRSNQSGSRYQIDNFVTR